MLHQTQNLWFRTNNKPFLFLYRLKHRLDIYIFFKLKLSTTFDAMRFPPLNVAGNDTSDYRSVSMKRIAKKMDAFAVHFFLIRLFDRRYIAQIMFTSIREYILQISANK